MTGFATALNEITLVLFTTLAPSGAVAYVIMGMAALRAQGDERKRLSGALLIPFLVTLVGLVASATHLGNPDNALYVFSRVGASPLSNEVCAAVLFLGISGLHWLYQFAEHARQRVLNVLLGAAMVASLAFLISVAFAYASRTVVTWDTPFVPVALCLNALVGGPVLTLFCLRFSRWSPLESRVGGMLLALS
ncbi:MAG: dimethyl sulfoxide reductase anchor subunit family protein, partial [Eggerthella lenta]